MKLKIYLQPGAKKSEIAGKHGDCMKIRVQSPPVDGKANEALIGFLAKEFGISKSSISISSGLKSRYKSVSIVFCDLESEKRIMNIIAAVV